MIPTSLLVCVPPEINPDPVLTKNPQGRRHGDSRERSRDRREAVELTRKIFHAEPVQACLLYHLGRKHGDSRERSHDRRDEADLTREWEGCVYFDLDGNFYQVADTETAVNDLETAGMR